MTTSRYLFTEFRGLPRHILFSHTLSGKSTQETLGPFGATRMNSTRFLWGVKMIIWSIHYHATRSSHEYGSSCLSRHFLFSLFNVCGSVRAFSETEGWEKDEYLEEDAFTKWMDRGILPYNRVTSPPRSGRLLTRCFDYFR